MLLSIVIPTKDRYPYLKHLINLIDSFESNEIEIVVQDNTYDNSDFLNSEEIKKVNYYYEKEQIPIFLNCDKAILHSTGEYICFIGDDDGLTPYALDCVRWMAKNNIEVVMPSTISYSWPDRIVKSKALKKPGSIMYKPFTGEIKKMSTKAVLEESIKAGFINRGNMPLVYHGLVKRSTLDKIYDRCGTFFPGASPDIANAVALCLSVDEFYKIDQPLTISGASKAHGGGVNKMKNRAANIEDVPFLPKDIVEKWDNRVPRIWTGETIWCQSAVMALKAMGRNDLVDKVNFEKMYARFAAFHIPLKGLAYNVTSSKFLLTLRMAGIVIWRYFYAAERLFFGLFGKNKDRVIVDGKETIIDAVKHLVEVSDRYDYN